MSEYSIRNFLKAADLITLLHVATGFWSILAFIMGDFYLGSGLIVVSAFLDYIDGKVARHLGKTTKFGKALDFADLIAFGVSPAIMISLLVPNIYTYISATIFVMVGLLRLSRFNITETEFSLGMTITVNGIVFPMLFTIFSYFNIDFIYLLTWTWLSSILMVSSFRINKII